MWRNTEPMQRRVKASMPSRSTSVCRRPSFFSTDLDRKPVRPSRATRHVKRNGVEAQEHVLRDAREHVFSVRHAVRGGRTS
jgi:hypothetical protein